MSFLRACWRLQWRMPVCRTNRSRQRKGSWKWSSIEKERWERVWNDSSPLNYRAEVWLTHQLSLYVFTYCLLTQKSIILQPKEVECNVKTQCAKRQGWCLLHSILFFVTCGIANRHSGKCWNWAGYRHILTQHGSSTAGILNVTSSCLSLSLYPEASEKGEEGQKEAAGGTGVWVKEEGESGGRPETLILVLPLSWAAACCQQQQQEWYDKMFVVVVFCLPFCLISLYLGKIFFYCSQTFPCLTFNLTLFSPYNNCCSCAVVHSQKSVISCCSRCTVNLSV